MSGCRLTVTYVSGHFCYRCDRVGPLQQIIDELTVGIYLHDTVPFFSLHFNADATMYPVIHPAYQNTLVGHICGMADYFLKAFLNGGFFKEGYIEKWIRNPNNNSIVDKSQTISIAKYFAETVPGDVQYYSLRQLMQKAGLSGFNTKFRSSFRIIAKQNEEGIKKKGNVFLLNPDFDIEYTIEPMPEYETYVKNYEATHGKPPEDWEKTHQVYFAMTQQIKRLMPYLPKCREYFEQLGIINFLCYYFKTMKQLQKVPANMNFLMKDRKRYAFPPLLPPLPTQYGKVKKFTLSVKTIIQDLSFEDKKILSNFILNKANKIKKMNLGALTKENIKDKLEIIFSELGELDNRLILHIKEKLNKFCKTSDVNSKEINVQITEESVLSFVGMLIVNFLSLETVEKKQKEARTETQAALDKIAGFTGIQMGINVDVLKSQLRTSLQEVNSLLENIHRAYHDPLAVVAILEETIELPFDCIALEIPDNNELDNTGKNFRLFGGCGMHLSPLKVVDSIEAEKIEKGWFPALQSKIPGIFTSFLMEGKTYFAFRLAIQSYTGCQPWDYIPLKPRLPSYLSTIISGNLKEIEKKFRKENLSLRDEKGFTVLHYAVATKNPEIVKFFMKRGLSAKLCAVQQQTPLHLAATAGLIATVKCLIEETPLHDRNSVLNAAMDNGATPLYLAAMKGYMDMIAYLLTAGASSTVVLTSGATPLYAAIHYQHSAAALLLLQYSRPVIEKTLEDGTTPLYAAAELGLLNVVQALLKSGAKHTARRDKKTPLHTAVSHGKENVVKELLRYFGKNIVNVALDSGVTSLHLAAEIGASEIIDALFAEGADPHLKGWEEVPLISAIRYGQEAAAIKLISRMQGPCTTREGETAYHLAAQLGLFSITDQLIKTDKQLFSIDKQELSVLHYLVIRGDYRRFSNYFDILQKAKATRQMEKDPVYAQLANEYRQPEMLACLRRLAFQGVALDAQLSLVDAARGGYLDWLILGYQPGKVGLIDGKNLLYLAAESGHQRIVAWLFEQKESMNPPAGHVLLAAAESGSIETVQYLLQKVSHPNNVVDLKKNTIAHIAALQGHLPMLKFLQSCGLNFLQRNGNNQTVFHCIVEKKWSACWRYLTKEKNHFEIPEDLLLYLAANANTEWLSGILKRQEKYCWIQEKTTGDNLLHAAVRSKTLMTVQLVSAIPQLLEEKNAEKHTPLSLAVQLNQIEIVQYLAMCGANLQVCFLEQSLLDIAYQQKALPMAWWLAEKGVLFRKLKLNLDLTGGALFANQQLEIYLTALIKNEPKDAISVLNQLRLDVCYSFALSLPHISLQGDYHLLSIAILLKSEKVIQYFFSQKNVSLTDPDQNGRTAIEFFILTNQLTYLENVNFSRLKLIEPSRLIHAAIHAMENNFEIFSWIAKRVDPWCLSKDGNSGLHEAVKAGQTKIVEWYCQQKKNLDLCDSHQMTPLAYAIIKGYGSMVARLLKEKIRLDRTFQEPGLTYLHLAVAGNRPEILLMLLAHGLRCLKPTRDGRLPLHIAAMESTLPTVKIIAGQTPHINAVDKKNQTVLHFSAMNDDPAVTTLLLEEGADPNKCTKMGYPLEVHARQRRVKNFYRLLEYGAKWDEKKLIDAISEGCSPELIAWAREKQLFTPEAMKLSVQRTAARDSVEQLKKLQGWGFKLDDEYLNTSALEVAIFAKANRAVSFLLRKYPELGTRKNLNGLLPVQRAIQAGNVNALRQLLSLTQDVSGEIKRVLLHEAAASGYPAVVVALLSVGVNPNERDPQQQTPLHLAAEKTPEAIPFLLAMGADPRICNNIDKTPRMLLRNTQEALMRLMLKYEESLTTQVLSPFVRSIVCHNKEGFRFLLQQKTAFDEQDKFGNTLLHIAIKEKARWAINALIGSMMPLNFENKEGLTPILVALKEWNLSDLKKLTPYKVLFHQVGKIGTTAIEYCYNNRLSEKLRWLIQLFPITSGCDLEKIAKNGDIRQLSLAIQSGTLDCQRLIEIDRLKDILKHDNVSIFAFVLDGITEFSLFSERNQGENFENILKLLIKYGDNKTFSYVINRGAIFEKNKKEMLFYSISHNSLNFTKYFLEKMKSAELEIQEKIESILRKRVEKIQLETDKEISIFIVLYETIASQDIKNNKNSTVFLLELIQKSVRNNHTYYLHCLLKRSPTLELTRNIFEEIKSKEVGTIIINFLAETDALERMTNFSIWPPNEDDKQQPLKVKLFNWAIEKQSEEILKHLLAITKIDVNAKIAGTSALHRATKNLNIFNLIISASIANPYLKDDFGKLAIEMLGKKEKDTLLRNYEELFYKQTGMLVKDCLSTTQTFVKALQFLFEEHRAYPVFVSYLLYCYSNKKINIFSIFSKTSVTKDIVAIEEAFKKFPIRDQESMKNLIQFSKMV